MAANLFTLCLDSIFKTYLAVKPHSKPALDKYARKPNIILNIAHELDLIPSKNQIIRITGSKGKGSTSRFIAAMLQNIKQNEKVGLIISPEEITHTDRMQINGRAITEELFIDTYNLLKPCLAKHMAAFTTQDYFSPSGIFLLIALHWFKEQQVRHFVFECGRGVLYDEIGNIPSNISVISSIFNEHLEYLGPTIEDIALNKLSIINNSDLTIIDKTTEYWVNTLQILNKEKIINSSDYNLSERNFIDMPHWTGECYKLASLAVNKYLHTENTSLSLPNIKSPSFGRFTYNDIDFIYEGLISKVSLDGNFYKNIVNKYNNNCAIIFSLPDDKDFDNLVNYFSIDLEADTAHIVLTGKRGYLHYTQAQQTNRIIGQVDINHPEQLKTHLNNFVKHGKYKCLVLIGTQTFLRIIKQAYTGF